MELSSDLNILTLYPSGLFLVFLCLFVIYWIFSVIGGLDQSFGMDFDGDIDIETSGVFSSLMVSYGLSKVPLSIGLTITSFIGFVISSLLQLNVLGMFFNYSAEFNPYDLVYIGASTIVVVVSLFASLWLAGKFVKPLIPLFDDSEKNMDIDYIGLEAKVRSSKVSDTFGEILLVDGFNEHILTVCSSEEGIVKNDQVVIISYDEKIKRYLVQKIN
jgi:hypothetical protein